MQDRAVTLLRPGVDIGIGAPIGTAQTVTLVQRRRVLGDVYLDGNQYSGTVPTVAAQIVEDSPTFTGVEGVLEAIENGCWRLLNQGDVSYGLVGAGSGVHLQSVPGDLRSADPGGDWLIYWTGLPGQIMLRPQQGVWLATSPEDTTAHLSRERDVEGKWLKWAVSVI